MAILDTWYGRNVGGSNQSSYSQRTDQTNAGKAGLFQPKYGPSVPVKKKKVVGGTVSGGFSPSPIKTKNAASSTSRTSSSQPTATTPTEPQLTKEQQLQLDADSMGLTGAERQAFIEEKRGILPKIGSSKKYSDVTSAEKDAGIATSAPADAGADEVAKEIDARLSELTSGTTDTTNAESATKGTNLLGLEKPTDADYKALYDAQLAGDDAKYQTLLDIIKAKYENAQSNQAQLGNNQAGQTAKFLARAGAFSSAGGQSMIASQQQETQDKITALAKDEANALAEAADAKRSGDLTRLESYLQKADQLREERNNIQLKNVEYGQQLDEAAKTKATEQATYLGNLTLDQFNSQDPEYIAQVEQQLGMPTGYLKNLATTQAAIAQAESESAAMEQSMKLFDLAKELPDGMSYQFADGTTIQGFMQPEGKVMQVTTATGDVAFVTIDPATGEVLKNVQLPGLISEIKAARMFGGSSGGSGSGGKSRNGSVLSASFDDEDKLILSVLQQSVGMTLAEAYDKANRVLGTQLSLPEGMTGSEKFTSDDAYITATNLSDNLASDPGSTYSAMLGDYAFRDINVDGEDYSIVYDKTNPNNAEWFNTGNLGSPVATTQKSSGSWWDSIKSLWSGANEDVNK